jgi:hypothetical protein
MSEIASVSTYTAIGLCFGQPGQLLPCYSPQVVVGKLLINNHTSASTSNLSVLNVSVMLQSCVLFRKSSVQILDRRRGLFVLYLDCS